MASELEAGQFSAVNGSDYAKVSESNGLALHRHPAYISNYKTGGVTRFQTSNSSSGDTVAFEVAGSGLVTFNQGIAFQSATTGSGTGTGYTLDSYETGTFTPTISAENGTINGTEQFGRYTRVGNMVHVSFSIKCTGVSSASGAVGFAGMPFTSANVDSSFNTALTVRYSALGSAVESVICRLFSNSAGGRIEEQTGTYTSNLADNVQNNTVFQVSGSYLV